MACQLYYNFCKKCGGIIGKSNGKIVFNDCKCKTKKKKK
jgi:hypothetical protein